MRSYHVRVISINSRTDVAWMGNDVMDRWLNFTYDDVNFTHAQVKEFVGWSALARRTSRSSYPRRRSLLELGL